VGDLPAPPAVIYAQPVIIAAGPGYAAPPVYLRVRPGYERHWAEHCAEYHACARRVYFVRDDWYNRVYVPRYRHVDRDDFRDHDGFRDHDDFRRHEEYRHHEEQRRFDRDDHDRGEHRWHDDRRDDHDHGDRHDH